MKQLSTTQQIIIDIIQRVKQASATDVAKQMQSDPKTVARHLRRMEQEGHVHVTGWGLGKYNGQMKLYAYGAGEAAPMVKKSKKAMSQDAARKAFTKRNTYDPAAPVMPNNGWVSTIYAMDHSMSQLEHIKFMERFQPHPDHAAKWLFNKPKVELLGARYE
jgi:DNA-binding transcriptional regulator YhcF (GntR family)